MVASKGFEINREAREGFTIIEIEVPNHIVYPNSLSTIDSKYRKALISFGGRLNDS